MLAECWLNHLDEMTDEEITEKLNSRSDRTLLDKLREKHSETWNDRSLARFLTDGYWMDWYDVLEIEG